MRRVMSWETWLIICAMRRHSAACSPAARAVMSPAVAEVSTCNRSAMLLRNAPTLALTKLMPEPTIAAIQPEATEATPSNVWPKAIF